MDSDTLMAYGVPTITFLVSGLGTYFLGRYAIWAGLKAYALCWLVLSVLLTIGVFTADGWDGLYYVAGLIGIMAPAGVGGLIGGWIGRTRKVDGPQTKTSTGARHTDPSATTR